MNPATSPGWIKPAASILILVVAVHVLFTAMLLGAITLGARDFGAPIFLALVLYVAIFWTGVWAARRLWPRWLIALSLVLTVYALVGFVLVSPPDPSDPNALGWYAASQLARKGVLFWGVVAGGFAYWHTRHARRPSSALPPKA